jgi:hypothetical protein
LVQQIADKRDLDFVLYEQLGAEQLTEHARFRQMNRKMFDMVLKEARNFAVKELLPVNAAGDKEGLTFENNAVRVPECFHRAYALMRRGDWIAMTVDPEFGGQGLPFLIAQAAEEYVMGADASFAYFLFTARGAAKMIEIFGTARQKALFLEKLYSGQWGGTMVLTEPEAGSDVGALTTTAVRNEDGSYTISGNKIFITCGEHDLTENIVYPVLARIEGAPQGTKGISLFLVSKFRLQADGRLGERNDVVCTAIEEKLGIHASPTCQLTFGAKGQCRGWLLGEENKGMREMFHMMNEARLGTGALAQAIASRAYLHALDYARQRVQGKALEDSFKAEAPSVPIIRHPDVRRMLLWMKSHVEGMRSFVYYTASLFDRMALAADEAERTRYLDLIGLLTPVIKAYCSERGFEVTVQAMQVFGGYGYTADYPVERLLRDSKINSIYEGANGIQAMDLLARKLGMKNGQVFASYLQAVGQIVGRARELPPLAPLAEQVAQAVDRLAQTARLLGERAMSAAFKRAFAHASPFLEAMGEVSLAWMLLWRATVALPALDRLLGDLPEQGRAEAIAANKQAAFYEGQLQSAKFFIQSMLPVTLGRMEAIAAGCASAVEMP